MKLKGSEDIILDSKIAIPPLVTDPDFKVQMTSGVSRALNGPVRPPRPGKHYKSVVLDEESWPTYTLY